MSAKTKRSIRTALQTAVALAAVAPAVLGVPGAVEALPWLGSAAIGAGVLARVMAMPAVERLLDRFGLGLVDDEATGR